MKTTIEDIEILSSKNQLRLFGYEDYFISFIKLFEKKEMPNSILLSGLKGLGKSTFAYHIINYLLSKNEEGKYSVKNLVIDETNLSYRLLNTNTHPNFFLIENVSSERDIKIEQVRNLLQFLSKSTYTRDLKIIMIDNAEYLNLSSSNALLKAIEEPQNNTFFFIIRDNATKILDTIRSRCIEFNFFFTTSQKNRHETDPKKSHVNWAILDSDWEGKFCQVAESHPMVISYVKNHNLGFEIPYRKETGVHRYIPDFIVQLQNEDEELINLIVEIKGFRRQDADDKKMTMETYWVPGVNNHGGFGKWAFAEFTEIFQLKNDFDDTVKELFDKMVEKVIKKNLNNQKQIIDL